MIAVGFAAVRRAGSPEADFPAVDRLVAAFLAVAAGLIPAVLSTVWIAMATGCWTPTKWKDRRGS